MQALMLTADSELRAASDAKDIIELATTCPPSLAVATLVFFPRTTGACVVAPDLIGLALHGSRTLIDRFLAVTHHDLLRTLLLLLDLFHVLLAAHLNRKDLLDHVLTRHPHHRLEHLESFLLVFDQRILLSIAAQPNALFQMVHREQMILPQ